MDVTTAYRYCEEVTSTQARNFSYGIKLLPPPKRRALSAVYAFARRIDDIGDGTMPAPDKLAALAEARAAVQGLAGGHAPVTDPVLVALADACHRFPIPAEAFGEIVDGCVADVQGTSYRTFDDLLHYCRCVAGSVGRLTLGVFGAQDQGKAAPLADALGVALQLTNILRDIREDYENGRVYLPAEDLGRFGIDLNGTAVGSLSGSGGTAVGSLSGSNGTAVGSLSGSGGTAVGFLSGSESTAVGFLSGSNGTAVGSLSGSESGAPRASEPLANLIGFEAERARAWYATGLKLLPMLDRRSAASAAAMAGIYRRLLERIAEAPTDVLNGRLSLSTGEKITVAVRSLVGTAVRSTAAGRLPGQKSRQTA